MNTNGDGAKVDRMNVEVVGLEQSREVEHVRDSEGVAIDSIAGPIQTTLILVCGKNGVTIRIPLSDDNFKNIVEALKE